MYVAWRKIRSTLLTAALAAGLATGAQAGPAITLTTPGDTFDGTLFTLGFEFSVVAPETIKAFGVYDDMHDGLSHRAMVGLWDMNRNLLAEATIPAGAGSALIGDFRYVSITPFTLAPGTDYVIGSFLPGDLASSMVRGQNGFGIVDPNVLVVEDRFSNGGTFAFADMTTHVRGGAWLGANFTDESVPAVPEPATLALFAAGALGAIRRRRKQ